MNKIRMHFVNLLSQPMFKEAMHRRMRKLEMKLKSLASVYFGEEITIMYIKKIQKSEVKYDEQKA